jgi:hypothetical protein
MIITTKTPYYTLDRDALEMFEALHAIDEMAMLARNAIYNRYAKLCCFKPHEISIDDKTGEVSVIETSGK